MTKLKASYLVKELEAARKRGDGYIMGSRGQNPRTGYLDLSVTKVRSSWKTTGWYYTQYTSSKQKAKALYWREHATRVWDCAGMAEGIYEIATGTCVDTKARYIYASWCDTKGSGMIPTKYRVPGAAVFWSDSSAGSIHHIGYLIEPVTSGKPEGDWYITEARGVMYGVVRTKLNSRKPNYWGLMTKYYDYSEYLDGTNEPSKTTLLGDRTLKNGCEGDDVKELQSGLIRLGYDLGRWGADGDFGDCTEEAVRTFQRHHGLSVDGIAGPQTISTLETVLASIEAAADDAPEADKLLVQIVGGQCYCRTEPNTGGKILGVAREGERLEYAGETSENLWNKVKFKDSVGWVSGKYSRIIT